MASFPELKPLREYTGTRYVNPCPPLLPTRRSPVPTKSHHASRLDAIRILIYLFSGNALGYSMHHRSPYCLHLFEMTSKRKQRQNRELEHPGHSYTSNSNLPPDRQQPPALLKSKYVLGTAHKSHCIPIVQYFTTLPRGSHLKRTLITNHYLSPPQCPFFFTP